MEAHIQYKIKVVVIRLFSFLKKYCIDSCYVCFLITYFLS